MANVSGSAMAAAAEVYLRDELKTGTLRHQLFPMLTGFGIRDYADTVRTLGLNYVTEIGRRVLGMTAVSEYPVFPQGKYNARDYREVKLGSVWFEKLTNQPFLVGEFERYEEAVGQTSRLRVRVEDLLLGYHQLGAQPQIVLLVYWTLSKTNPPRADKFIKLLEQGFSLPNTSLVPGVIASNTKILVYYCLASGTRDNLILNQWIEIK
ncbi:MAG: hypothetical protein ACOX5W_04395 [Bacillota bacterium]|jgi:hypothetical protein